SSICVDPVSGRQGMCVHRSDASGANWTGPYEVTGAFTATTSADKEMIAVNVNTGRLIITWNETSSSSVTVRTSYSDDGGSTWSPVATVTSSSSILGPQIRFVPGATNATSQAYVAWTQANGFQIARSTDGGATWGAPIVLRAPTPYPDEAVGFDRAHLM